jgi:Subtilase family
MPDGLVSWEDRVAFGPGGGFAYRPREVLVRLGSADRVGARDLMLAAMEPLSGPGAPDLVSPEPIAGYDLVVGDFDPLVVVQALRTQQAVDGAFGAAFAIQPNHVLFADSDGLVGNPLSGNPRSGNPLSGNPLSGNPLSGNPLSGNPLPTPWTWNLDDNPRYSSRLHASPSATQRFTGVYAFPGWFSPVENRFARTGRGRCLARPADPPRMPAAVPVQGGTPRVAVVDVGLQAPPPARRRRALDSPLLGGCVRVPRALRLQPPAPPGVPDQDGDGWLDRVAGHGMFIASIIAELAGPCELRVIRAMSNLGDVDEWDIINILDEIRGQIDIVNLSFGGYALDEMVALSNAVSLVQLAPGPASDGAEPISDRGAVVVASAGNEGMWLPPYPARLPGVVSVAALGPDGPAAFSNYGPWVRACAPGVDVASGFYIDYRSEGSPGVDPDEFDGGASWSGTSFAAPLVVGRIAGLVRDEAITPKEAVRRLIDDPQRTRIPWHGTIVTR